MPSFEPLLRQKRTEGISMTLHSDPNEANKHAKPRRFSHYRGCRTGPNKGFSERGVSRASDVLALTTLVTRSAERRGGEGQKILCARCSNLDKSVFVTKTWLGFLLNSYFYILQHQRGQLTYECTPFGWARLLSHRHKSFWKERGRSGMRHMPEAQLSGRSLTLSQPFLHRADPGKTCWISRKTTLI